MKPKYLAAAAALVVAGGAHAASATFDFNLPAVGSNAVRLPYPTVATLTLVDVAGGVQFTLDPNETSSDVRSRRLGEGLQADRGSRGGRQGRAGTMMSGP